jgi:hypothetical protein
MSDMKITRNILEGKFCKNDTVYVVEQMDEQLSKLTKEGSPNFCVVGKIVFEEYFTGDNKLIVYVDQDAGFVLQNVEWLFMHTAGLTKDYLPQSLPEKIASLDGATDGLPPNSTMALVARRREALADVKPAEVAQTLAIINTPDMECTNYQTFEGDAFYIRPAEDGDGFEIRCISFSLLSPKDKYVQRVAQTALIEYKDGKRCVAGIDKEGHITYVSPPIKTQTDLQTNRSCRGQVGLPKIDFPKLLG